MRPLALLTGRGRCCVLWSALQEIRSQYACGFSEATIARREEEVLLAFNEHEVQFAANTAAAAAATSAANAAAAAVKAAASAAASLAAAAAGDPPVANAAAAAAASTAVLASAFAPIADADAAASADGISAGQADPSLPPPPALDEATVQSVQASAAAQGPFLEAPLPLAPLNSQSSDEGFDV